MPSDAARATMPLEISPSPKDADAAPTKAAVELAPADPETAPTVTARHPMRRTAAVLAAGGAHVLVLLALVSAPPLEYGSGGSGQDAISVSIISASALDARQPTTDLDAKSATGQMSPELGDDDRESKAEPETTKPPEPARERAADEMAEPDLRLAAPAEPAPEAVPDQAPKLTSPPEPPEETKMASAEPPTQIEKKEEAPPEKQAAQPKPETRTDGGETSVGAAPAPSPKAAAAEASRGQMIAYGIAVQSALLAVDQSEARVALAATKAKGTVVIKLILDRSGALTRAEIATSSGIPRLDELALLLTRQASFPPPPAELAATELAYTAPIRFR